MIEGSFYWGTNYENILTFAYPQLMDDTRTWRRPAPGSRRARNPAGTTDGWINKRDFVMATRLRYFKPAVWGGLGVQDFLDYCADGTPFRFVPDNRYPKAYVDGCILDEPFEDPAPELEASDGSQAIGVVIRQQTTDFTLALRGLFFEYVPGKSITDPIVATFTRTSTAPYTDVNNQAQTAASGALRDRHYDAGTTRTTRLQLNWASQTQPDVLYWPITIPTASPATLYVKFKERGAKDTSGCVILDVGGATGALMQLRRPGTSIYQMYHNNGSTSASGDTATLAHALGDTVELRGVIRADGSVLIGICINGGAEVVSAASGVLTPAAAWNQNRIALASDSASLQPSDLPVIVARIGVGELTLAQIRAA